MCETFSLTQISVATEQAVQELLNVAKLKAGDILVVGCSSSEVQKKQIGTASSEAIGNCIYKSLHGVLALHGIYLAAQCCEHLNRALVIEAEAAQKYGYTRVNVIPQLKAGGSFATAAYASMKEPHVVEEIQAAAGIDIGGTLIGMHLRPVAVPIRASIDQIGSAHLILARTRAKSIGGERAVYDAALR